MTTEYLELMKADLLAEYKDELCEESVESIKNANTIEDFIGLLSKFSVYLSFKFIPEVWWVRKWFNNPERKSLAEKHGVYFNGHSMVVNPQSPIVVMGDAHITLTCTKPSLYRVLLQDECNCDVSTFYNCRVMIRQKDNSQCNIIHKNNLSSIKIRKI